jgi:hypothetical protein
VKEFLSREAVPFTAYNVDEDERAYDDLVARGLRTIPVTVFGDWIVKGFDPGGLAALLAAWRAQPDQPAQS